MMSQTSLAALLFSLTFGVAACNSDSGGQKRAAPAAQQQNGNFQGSQNQFPNNQNNGFQNDSFGDPNNFNQQGSTFQGQNSSGAQALPDTQYATALWASMQQSNLVGQNRFRGEIRPQTASASKHGALVETTAARIDINGVSTEVILKHNYGPAGVTRQQALNQADALKAITVMAKREAGYNPNGNDFFFAKFLPTGNPEPNGNGGVLAGKLGNPSTGQGCMGCHANAQGGDFQFINDN